jgi:predicted esterase
LAGLVLAGGLRNPLTESNQSITHDRMKLHLFSFMFLLLSPTLAKAGESRPWTNTEGKVIIAEFVGSDGTQVTLLMNGKETKYALSKLSEADRDFVARQENAPAQTDKASTSSNAKTGWMDHIAFEKPAYASTKEYLEEANAMAIYKAIARGDFPKEWAANKGTVEEMFSYDKGAMIVYIPASYNPAKPMGVYLHISPGDNGGTHKNYMPIMDRFSMIHLSPKGTSNSQPMLRRAKLAVDALAEVKKQWKVDEKRVCVGGLSGGGHMAMFTHAMFPQWFSASISHAAQIYLPLGGSCGHFPGLEARDITGKDCKDHKWVVISGDKDFNYKEILKTTDDWKAARANYLFIDVPGMGHTNASPERLEEALKWAGF